MSFAHARSPAAAVEIAREGETLTTSFFAERGTFRNGIACCQGGPSIHHRRSSPLFWIALGSMVWLAVLSCRTAEFLARAGPTPTQSPRPTTRPTFTRVPPTPLPLPTLAPMPTRAPNTPTRAPTARPSATRRPPTAPPTAPPPPSATPDLYQGYYYRVLKNECVTATNTRAEGTVFNNGFPENGIKVRIANGNGGDPVIDDFTTGVDPSDYAHKDPALQGKYRLGVAEGQQIDGNWWVFVVNSKGEQISVGAYFKTHDGPGCNTAFIDFAH